MLGLDPLARITPAGGDGPGGPDGGSAPVKPPVKAVINLLVSAGTLLGWSAAPGEIPGFGLLDPRPPATSPKPPPPTRKPAGA